MNVDELNSLYVSNTWVCGLGLTNQEDGGNVKSNYDISHVDLITNEENVLIGVRVQFASGDTQKAICNGDDVFSLETGIMICLAKHLLHLIGHDNPTKTLNKFVRSALKQYDNQMIAELEEEDRKNKLAFRRAKRAEKKKRREERKREEAIEMQKEAYLRAMREFDKETIDRKSDDLK